MRKFIKLFLLTTISICFLGITFAQDWDNPNYNNLVVGAQRCAGDSFGATFSHFFLILILLIIIPLSIGTIVLRRQLRNSPEGTKLFYIPLLNLYPLCKITIGRVWFYCLILFIGFFVYLLYKDRDGCYSHYLQKLLLPICIVGVLSMCILLALLVKSIIYSRKLDKESSHEQNIK